MTTSRITLLASFIGAGQLAAGCSSGEIGANNQGTAGTTGGAGTTGAAGATGASGATGRGGATGASGATGRGGATGAAGASGGGTSGGTPSGGGTVSGCRIFPADNPWNQDVSGPALHAMNATFIANMNASRGAAPRLGDVTDFYGIPYTVGNGRDAAADHLDHELGPDESDMLPCPTGTNKFCYPIPLSAPIEGGPQADSDADRHILYVDTAGGPDNCTLYELYQVQNPGSSGFTAANGAIFHLGSNALRPDGWTSADAAGLPILPGLVRLRRGDGGRDPARASGSPSNNTQKGFIHPATHQAGADEHHATRRWGCACASRRRSTSAASPRPTLVILNAMKKYGIILADNGSDWYFTGESNNGWGPYMDDLITDLGKIHGSDFEVVDTGPVLTD